MNEREGMHRAVLVISMAAACVPGGGDEGSTAGMQTGGPSSSDATLSTAATRGGFPPSAASSTAGSAADGPGTSTGGVTDTAIDGGVIFDVDIDDVPSGGCVTCSADLHDVVTCGGELVEACSDEQACDFGSLGCIEACQAAANNRASIGCEYWATKMDHSSNYDAQGMCLAVFVANTWSTAVHIEVEFDGVMLPPEGFVRIPSGVGPGTVLDPYDAAAGLPPDEVAVLFLSGPTGTQEYGKEPCPVDPAVAEEVMFPGTGIGHSFRVTTDAPVVAYQMTPYGAGAGGAVAGASLLLPTSAWDTDYIATMAYGPDLAGEDPSMNIVASEDGTTVTLVPVVAVAGGPGVPAGPAGVPLEFTLDRGEHAQLTQGPELTGSVLQASAPVGLMAGHNGLRVPNGVGYADHAEQMIPPIRAWGSEYVGVMHRPRGTEPAVWRVIGAVDGTSLEWSNPVGGPATLEQGQVAEFITGDAFVVRSQDAEHPFLLATYMSGSQWAGVPSGHGDADFVIGVPPSQFLSRYVFFMDPSYPEANIVLVRTADGGPFEPVELDCLGPVGGWQPVGDYEWTRVDLMTGNYEDVGGCSTGRHIISSDAPFGLWVWGWGNSETTMFTANRSYGYPGGMSVRPINDVSLEPPA